ncbi:MAG: asparaginase [Acidobacteria bacterium]|nr:asparaginase [Acidobacteriota bacterium]
MMKTQRVVSISLFAFALHASVNGQCAAGGARAEEAALPLVKVVATGGTIAHLPTHYISGADLVAAIPDVKKYARLDVEEFSRVGSASITIAEWMRLARRINQILESEKEVRGVVVTHGSNTLAETGYFLSLTVKSRKPVVLTAAQRLHNSLSADGPRNFLDAVRTAIAEEAVGKGVLLVTNDEINAAREVTKTMSYRVNTYSSRDLGDLGFVDEDRVTFYRAPLRRHTVDSEFDLSGLQSLPRVDIIYVAADMDGALVEAAVKAGSQGLVLAGFPTGSPAPGMQKALKEAAEKGLPLVMTNRGGEGRITEIREGQGYQFIGGDNLSPEKARILLMLALTRTKDLGELRRIFREY